MPGSTTELGLATAVDSDDNADYLTLSLANSLRTVDALFNNVTGHTHGGAHQGGPVNTTPAAGSITSTMIQDGTIATADLANAAVTNAKLASDTARTSLLTNGGLEIWQRGNGPFTVVGAYAPDRWFNNVTAPTTLSISRDATNQDAASGACAACTVASYGNPTYLSQKLEDFTQLRGKTITASVRVRTSTPGAVFLRLADSVAGVNSANHSGGGAYETLTVTLAVASNATIVQLSVGFAANCTAYVDNAMLVVGSQAADYAPLHPADDLARCLRYYEVVGGNSNSFLHAGWAGAAGEAIGSNLRWRATKAVTPTLTLSGSWSVVNCGQPTAAGASTDGAQLFATATAIGHVQFISGGTIALSAEANP